MASLEEIVRFFFIQQQPWYVYALLGLIPICILISIREFSCWFWKINKMVDRLEKIEHQVRNMRLGTQIPTAEVRKFDRKASGEHPVPEHRQGPVERGPAKRGPTEL